MVQPDGSPIPEGAMAADVNATDIIPQRYRQAGEQPLFEVVVPGQSGAFDFAITSK